MGSFSTVHWILTAFFIWVIWKTLTAGKDKTKKSKSFKPDTAPSNPDAVDGSFWDVTDPKPSDMLVHLVYRDGQGLKTRRTVNVCAFGTEEEGAFSAKCLMRNAYRTFIYKRVEQAIDPETGEIISNLPSWLNEAYKSTPQGKASKLAFENLDLLKILLYVAKADGRMTAAEIAVISATATEITGTAIDIEATKTALNTLNTPSISGFKLAISRLIKENRTTSEKALIGAKNIVNTQKTAHAEEIAAIEYFESKLIAT